MFNKVLYIISYLFFLLIFSIKTSASPMELEDQIPLIYTLLEKQSPKLKFYNLGIISKDKKKANSFSKLFNKKKFNSFLIKTKKDLDSANCLYLFDKTSTIFINKPSFTSSIKLLKSGALIALTLEGTTPVVLMNKKSLNKLKLTYPAALMRFIKIWPKGKSK